MKALNTVWFLHATILLEDIIKELVKKFVESSSSRYVYYIKISIDLVFAKPHKLFPRVFRLFHVL